MEGYGWYIGWFIIALLKLVSTHEICSILCNRQSSELTYRFVVLMDVSYGLNCELSRDIREERNLILQAMNYTNNKVDQGYTIDFDIVDTCSDYSYISKIINDYLPAESFDDITILKESDTCPSVCSDNTTRPSVLVGFISQSLVYEPSLTELLRRANFPVLVTDSFDGADRKHDNLTLAKLVGPVYSIGYGLRDKIKAMFLLMIEMNWDYVTVVYSDDKLGHESLRIYDLLSTRFFVCSAERLPVSFSKPDLSDIKTRGVVYLGSENIGVHVTAQVKNKVLVTALRRSFTPAEGSTLYTVRKPLGSLLADSLVYYTTALTKTLCDPENAGDCGDSTNFRDLFSGHLDDTVNEGKHFAVSENGNYTEISRESVNASYGVYMSSATTLSKVASIVQDEVNFTSMETKARHTANPSICVEESCKLNCSALNQQDLLYVHGEYIILVAIQIRDNIDPQDMWGCTNMTAAGLFRVETVLFALKTLKRVLSDFNFGLLIMDSCYNYLKTAGDLFGILQNRNNDICENGSQTRCLNPDKIVAVVAGDSSGTTRQLHTIVREIPIIQITYGATSTSLSDRTEYPFLLRPHPTDSKQTDYMVQLLLALREKGNTINAVNIVYSNSLYGRGSYEELKLRLKEAGICYNLELMIEENSYTPESIRALINRLLSQESKDVDIIITYLALPHITLLMEQLNNNATLRAVWLARHPGFTFIHSDTWNNDEEKLQKYGELVKGSFTFGFNTDDFGSTSFRDHLKNWHLTPLHKTKGTFNPFMTSLTELQGKCKVRGSFLTSYTNLCEDLDKPITFSTIDGEMVAMFLMKALTIAVYGLRTVAHDNNENILFSRDTEIVNRTYWSLIKSRIPLTLESKDRSSGTQQFLMRSANGLSYGDGRSDFSIWQIKATDPFEYKYDLVTDIEFSSGNQVLLLNKEVFEFYSNGEATTYISSWSPRCTISTNVSATTMTAQRDSVITADREWIESDPTKDGTSNQNNYLVVAVSVVMVIIFVAGSISSILLWWEVKRLRQKFKEDPLVIADETVPGPHSHGSRWDSRSRNRLASGYGIAVSNQACHISIDEEGKDCEIPSSTPANRETTNRQTSNRETSNRTPSYNNNIVDNLKVLPLDESQIQR